ncbi:hypothetical protein RRF57_003829 [Xylaria bambusicola]|uniref:ATP synthase subunit 4 n=1 Tax=Xylaria bambusicola TaxID=326684 RepID=A0AAN7UV56_9PEZI
MEIAPRSQQPQEYPAKGNRGEQRNVEVILSVRDEFKERGNISAWRSSASSSSSLTSGFVRLLAFSGALARFLFMDVLSATLGILIAKSHGNGVLVLIRNVVLRVGGFTSSHEFSKKKKVVASSGIGDKARIRLWFNQASIRESSMQPFAPGAARVRPTVSPRAALPAVTSSLTVSRSSSNVPDPKVKAQSLVDSLPGNSLISKTAILSSAAGLSIYAISSEYYVVNEETIVAFCLLSVWGALIKFGGPMYKEWAQAQNEKIKGILNAARADHTQAVKNRIDNVQQMGGVVDVTKALFEVSKETAQLEAKAYELEQTTALAAEAKAVLDSWVRYEGQVKQRQQKELAESVIAKVRKELENPKTLQQILQQSVADVESEYSLRPILLETSGANIKAGIVSSKAQ